MGLCLLGTMETMMPLQAGRVEPPKNSTIHRHATATKMFFTSVMGSENRQARMPRPVHSSRDTTLCLPMRRKTINFIQ